MPGGGLEGLWGAGPGLRGREGRAPGLPDPRSGWSQAGRRGGDPGPGLGDQRWRAGDPGGSGPLLVPTRSVWGTGGGRLGPRGSRRIARAQRTETRAIPLHSPGRGHPAASQTHLGGTRSARPLPRPRLATPGPQARDLAGPAAPPGSRPPPRGREPRDPACLCLLASGGPWAPSGSNLGHRGWSAGPNGRGPLLLFCLLS